MKASDLPSRFSIPFARDAGVGFTRSVPNTPSGTPGAAAMTTGFPPICFDPIAAGGIPPAGADFNGLLNQMSAWSRWQAAGGPVVYDASFQTAIGGYPLGAFVQSAVTPGLFFLNLADDNTTDPTTGGANWRALDPSASESFGTVGGTANALTLTTVPAPPTLLTGALIYARATQSNTATAVTLNWNGLGVKSIKLQNNSDPAVGQITGGAILQLQYDGTNWIWLNSAPLLTSLGAATAAGTANALTVTVAPLQALNAGLRLFVTAVASNTGAMTLATNGAAAVPIQHYDGSEVTAGEVVAGTVMTLYYTGIVWVWVSAPWAETASLGSNNKRVATMAALIAAAPFLYTSATTATPFTAFTFNYVNTSGGPVTRPLPPSPSVGDALTFADQGKVWRLNPFTLGRNGNTIQGLAQDLVCNRSNLQFSIWWTGSTWVLF